MDCSDCGDLEAQQGGWYKSGGRAFGLIFATLLIDIAAMGMTLPVLPGIIRGFVGGDLARAAQFAGLAPALAAGLEFVCAPVIGAISDRFGRKPVLLLGMGSVRG